MRTGTVSYKLEDLKKGVIIPIGFVGENDFTKVFFDAEEIYKKYPSASVSMKVQPPKGVIYPAAVTRDGNTVIWQVKEADVANRGGGELQLTFIDGDTKIKTYIAKTDVKRSLAGNGTAPDPVQGWIDDADEKLAEVEQALDDLAAMDNIAKTAQASDIGKALSPKTVENGVVTEWEYITPGGGTEDYTELDNKPSIAGVTLSGNKTLEDLGIAADDDLDNLAGEVSDVKNSIQGKQDAPETAGTSGQVLGLDSNLDPVWLTPSGGGVVDADFSDSSTNPVQNKVITKVVESVTEKKVSPNLYDKTTCNPQDGKVYNNSHQYTNSSSYAVTGKMPVEPSTQYIFTTLGIAAVQYVAQWSGEDGSTFVSETKIQGAAFTTGANTTFVEFEIFARSHTATEYTNAINSAMLIKGSTAPEVYEPYGKVTYIVPTSALNDAEAVEGAKNYTVMRSLVNIYDKSLAVDNKVFNTNKLVDNSNYAFTGLIPVEPNKQYCFSIQKGLEYGYISAWYQRWDSSKVFIDEVSGNQSTNFLNQIQTTATTAYISFCIYFGAAHTTEAFEDAIDTVMVVEGCQEPAEYVPFNLEPVMNHLKMDTMYRDNADRFKGKRWLVTGTSVSYQDSKYYTEGVAEGEVVRGYIGNIARRKPMLVTNVAVSGSTLAGSDTNALINRYQNLDMGNYDFITIEYGINDFGNNVIVGTAQDAPGTGTFAACLKTIIEYALNQNPIVGLIICTDPDVRGTNVNQNGNTLKDYADVMLEIAAQYRLPVCDWFYHSGINSITKGDGSSRYFLTQSGTHPSVYGHMRMGAMLNQVFDSLLC